MIWRKVKILVELKELNSGKIYPILMMGGGRSREKRRIEIIELLKIRLIVIVNVISIMKVVVALVPSIAREGENGGQEESQRVKTSIQMGQI